MISQHSEHTRAHRGGLFIVGCCIVLSLLLAACGANTLNYGNSPTPTAKPSIAPPTDLLTPGTLTVGSDTTYPPQEFPDVSAGAGHYTGFDVDLITAMAARMGLKTLIVKADFTTIITSLQAKRFDVVMSAVSITPDRQKVVDFVPYFNAGESLLVAKGNPHNFKTIADLCGQNVGVQDGTIEQSDLNAASQNCVKSGKQPIHLTVLSDQTAVIQLLANNRVVATYQDSPVTDYFNKQFPGKFDVAGSVVNAGLEGVVVRKGDTSMFNAIQAAFNAVKADGTYHQLILKWGLVNEELTAIDRPAQFYA
jgi:polar amino acid transport system substrate-binding protein